MADDKIDFSYFNTLKADGVNGVDHLLGKLRQVFRDGYRPARGAESYNVRLKNGLWAYQQVNCLGHVFNLRNQQFNDYDFKPYRMFGDFVLGPWENKHAWLGQMLDFIKDTGLKVEECSPKETITDFKSWKTALYFVRFGYSAGDFHYLLEDMPNQWSSKCGFRDNFEQLNLVTPPLIYKNQIDRSLTDYDFYGTYKITNPNADPNNPYVKDHYAPERGL